MKTVGFKKLTLSSPNRVRPPAAASMDMFRDYKARGDAFVAAVRALADR